MAKDVDRLPRGDGTPVPAWPEAAQPRTVGPPTVPAAERQGGPTSRPGGEVVLRHTIDAAHMSGDPRFVRMRRRFRRRTLFTVAVVLAWYGAYLALTAYARDVMALSVVGPLNVALALGLGQFASTFLLAWSFGRFAARTLDPVARELRAETGRPAC